MTIVREAARPLGARPRSTGAQSRMSYGFVVPYTILAAVFGVFPALYAVYLAFTDAEGGFAGAGNFTKVFGDFRFLPAVGHVATFLLIWLVALIVLVTFLAIVVHAVRVRWLSRTLRLVFGNRQ